MPFLQTNNLDEYITRYQQDGVLWKANRLLQNLDNPILRNDRTIEIANMLAAIPEDTAVMRDDYVKTICALHDLKPKTLEKLISECVARKVKVEAKKAVRKNKVKLLDTDPKCFPFFREFVNENKQTGERYLDKIKIDKLRFVQLLSSFGFSRYETPGSETEKEFTFVRLKGNVISSVTRDQIIDFIEHFVKTDYDFEKAKCEVTDSVTLINTFYDQMRTIFSKDLFARVRLEDKIIINQDTKDCTYLYFANGFVEINKSGWSLKPYEEMNGSVWENQMLTRSFTPLAEDQLPEFSNTAGKPDKNFFADFVWRIAGQNAERFKALCCIIGYLIHDYYEYKLKMIEFTDSTISDESEGRTGKTLLVKMIGQVRNLCEINGKDFDSANKNKYEDVKIDTQVVHLNDLKHKGRNKFDFEDVFNDITEGFMVNAKYMTPFRKFCKIVGSTNKSLNVKGASQRDRIIEFEMSNFFSEERSPADFYQHWFVRDWDEAEFNRFDNFMCSCAQMFHIYGIFEPVAINLGERKLRDHTAIEFIEFMDELKDNLLKTGMPWSGYEDKAGNPFKTTYAMDEYRFEKKKLYDRFINEYEDYKRAQNTWFTVRKFYQWIHQYAEVRFNLKKPKEWKSSGLQFIQFVNDKS